MHFCNRMLPIFALVVIPLFFSILPALTNQDVIYSTNISGQPLQLYIIDLISIIIIFAYGFSPIIRSILFKKNLYIMHEYEQVKKILYVEIPMVLIITLFNYFILYHHPLSNFGQAQWE